MVTKPGVQQRRLQSISNMAATAEQCPTKPCNLRDKPSPTNSNSIPPPRVTTLHSNPPPGEIQVNEILFNMRWRLMCQILLALPVVGIFVCLITSLMFHSDHINNTVCKVYNFLPSISAVTGVSPQRYLWRVAVALHISPRLLVAFVSRAHYASMATFVSPAGRPAYYSLVNTAFYLNLVELGTLCGVTYISNKENYPVHEKLFTLFMLVSLVYMLVVVRVFSCVKEDLSPALKRSFVHKKFIFGLKLAATAGLMFFFYRHRVHCLPKAFSWFSLCEYVIATCNMLYHVSVALDFSDHNLIVGQVMYSPQASNHLQVVSEAHYSNSDAKEAPLAQMTKVSDLQMNNNIDHHPKRLEGVEEYKMLNSDSDSVSRLHDQGVSGSIDSLSASEFAASSSPITSSLSRSVSSFSADSSSVGISESLSLDLLCKRRDESSDNLSSEDCDNLRSGSVIDGVIGVLLDCINDDNNTGEIINSKNNSGSATQSDSSELSDDGASASTVKATLNTINESSENNSYSSSPPLGEETQVHKRLKEGPSDSKCESFEEGKDIPSVIISSSSSLDDNKSQDDRNEHFNKSHHD